MTRSSSRVTDRDALACLFAAHRRHANRAFRVDLGGRNLPALLHCERLGWVWFSTPDRCSVTPDGVRALAPYGVTEEA